MFISVSGYITSKQGHVSTHELFKQLVVYFFRENELSCTVESKNNPFQERKRFLVVDKWCNEYKCPIHINFGKQTSRNTETYATRCKREMQNINVIIIALAER